jgi:phenylpropionate dioxygenase-like ring-hydroxylating dioxygenase large terminal subunit
MRFGQQLVFWRSNGEVVCMPDRCPHRGAALSLGRVNKSGCALVCPFHGLEFSAHGRCVRIPVEADAGIAENFGIATIPVREADGFVWLWRGAAMPSLNQAANKSVDESNIQSNNQSNGMLDLPVHPAVATMRYGEASGVWGAHYTRCIENVCDFSHLPFVHRSTIGMFRRETAVQIEMEDVPGGFRAYLLEKGARGQCFEFLYPNRWLLMLSPRMMLGLVFAPVDATHTAVYGRTYYGFPVPGLKWLMDGYTRLSQYLVFREDWPIVASQTPGDIRSAHDEKLFPSDAPVIAFRKLHRIYAGLDNMS